MHKDEKQTQEEVKMTGQLEMALEVGLPTLDKIHTPCPYVISTLYRLLEEYK
jgi:hypothetical protein